MEHNATCNACGATGLDWGPYYNPRTRSKGQRLFDHGVLHECVEYRNRLLNPALAPEPPVAATPATQASVDLAKIMAFVAKTLEAYDAKIADEVIAGISHKYQDTMRDAISGARAAAEVEADEVARRVIAELVPVEHVMVIKTGELLARSGGRPHYLMQDLLDCMVLGDHTYLVGPAGSGKTFVCEAAAKLLGRGYQEIPMSASSAEDTIVGYNTPDGHFIEKAAYDAYKNGKVLCLDEADKSDPSAMACLQSMLSNGHYTFPNGERVERHPDFVCIVCANTFGRGADRMYVGSNQLDAAFLNRFAIIEWDYDEVAEFDWAGRDQVEWVKYIQKIRSIVMRHRIEAVIGPRQSIKGANQLRTGYNREKVEKRFIWGHMSEDDGIKVRAELARV